VTNGDMVHTSIDAIAEGPESQAAFELLYEGAGLGRRNLDAQIVHSARLATERISIWQLGP
jgi:hypothetical protein